MAADSKLYTSRCLREGESRLLRVYPAASSSENIVCDLIHVPNLHASEYEALSYVWGSVEDKQSVEVSGNCVEVTNNLFNALKLLRLRDGPRDLWIDAVCINQQDKEERDCQVRQMGTIYKLAQQVVVVTERTLSPATFRALHRLCGDETLHWYKDIDSQQEAVFDDDNQFFELFIWLQDNWWDRLWTIQEAVLARKLVFVHESGDIDYSTLLKLSASYFIHLIEEKNKCCANLGQSLHIHDLRQSMIAIQFVIQQVKVYGEVNLNADILQLLSSFRRRRCTIDHDRVYGLMGITRTLFPEDFVDYEEPFTRIMERLTQEVIQQSGTLDILNHVLGPEQTARGLIIDGVFERGVHVPKRSYSLPSWVPDWNSYLTKSMHSGIEYRIVYLERYQASLDLECDSDYCAGELSLVGFIHDVVSDVGPIGCGDPAGPDPEWESWSKFFHDHPDFQTGGSRWLGLITGGAFTTADRGSDMSRTNAMIATTMDRRPFITRSGRVGLGPWSAEVGDKLCILFGGKTPYLIREDSDSAEKEDTRYIFLGDTYVPGLMQGEALNDPELVPRTIILGNSPPPTVEVECEDASIVWPNAQRLRISPVMICRGKSLSYCSTARNHCQPNFIDAS